jgi:hypothetical protein
MGTTKKEKWTEAEILALPPGEHDYFDRKSGALLADQNFRKEVAKALCAFANSGGGHLVIGITDHGVFDGVEPLQGRTPTREWFEQIIPTLLSYPLQDFRVHEAEPSSPSGNPQGKVVIVIDVGGSVLAPHQSAFNPYIYYYRAGGHSVPAPHFYLETLRNRLINPVLKAELKEIVYVDAARNGNDCLFIRMALRFRVSNIGRVAAYKWALIVEHMAEHMEGRESDYIFDASKFPLSSSGRLSGIKLDPTILPSLSQLEEQPFGVYLRPVRWDSEQMGAEFESMLSPAFRLGYRTVTETSVGEVTETSISDILGLSEVLRRSLERAHSD